jgi:predicted permease
MSWVGRVQFRARTLFGRAALERQLDEELQFHIDMQAALHMQLGMSPAAARMRARSEFGSVEQHKDDYRDRWSARQAETVLQDIRIGARRVWREPVTSIAVVLALSLGVGVSTAVFSVFHAVIVQPPPFSDAGRLVRVQAATARGERLFSAPEIRDLRAETRSLDSLAEFHFMYFILLDGHEPKRVSAGVVSSNFFDVIGVRPSAGRSFLPDEELAGAPGVIVLSHRYWQQEFGSDPAAVGRVVQMNDRPHTVVGILPPLPAFPNEADIYLPTSACPLRISDAGNNDRRMHLVSALGRMNSEPSTTLELLKTDLTRAAARIGARYHDDYGRSRALDLSAVAVADDLIWRFRPTMSLLLASAGFLLVSVSSSLGALLLARSLRRRRSVAMQMALGASRGRLFQQFLTESLVLTVIGGVAGLVLAHEGLPWLVMLASRYTPRAMEIELNFAAALFALAVAVLLAVACSGVMTMVSARLVSRPGQIGGRRHAARHPLLRGLVVLQVAVSFALLIGAGLVFKTVRNMQRVDTGYRYDVVTARISTDFIKYETAERRLALYRAVLDSVGRLPQVTDAALAASIPLIDAGGTSMVDVDARNGVEVVPTARAVLQTATSGYFRTLGLDMLEGRTFEPVEADRGANIAIINQTMAARLSPRGSAVGRQLRIDRGEWLTVVGVAADARQLLNAPAAEEVIVPLASMPPVQGRLLVRTSQPAARIATVLLAAVQRVEPGQPLDSVVTIDAARDSSVAPLRVTALLIAAFAVIGVAISLVGVAGVVGASVHARTSELGVRMALGATRVSVVRSVLLDGLKLAAVGLMPGLALALVLSARLRDLLFEVQSHDLATWATATILLVGLVLTACAVPARRAATIDPYAAIRVG